MRAVHVLAAGAIAALGIALASGFDHTTAPDIAASARAVWGGKMEHCGIAIGMIGGAILGMFANPLIGPIAIGIMTGGLVWLLTCA